MRFARVVGVVGLLSAVVGPAPAGNDDLYLRYVHPTVTAPFHDGVNLAVPAELENQETAALGLVDVTRGPFRADPTGECDATAALQAAIDFARDHQMVCFFPPGTYRVNDTLSCVQQLYRRSNGRVLGSHLWPCLLVGSRAGQQRPKILLAAKSPGFGDPAKPKIVLYFWARGYANPTTAGRVGDGLSCEQEQPNISMNQMLVNLDLVIGEGNPGAVAVRHQAAEGSGIEDCAIDATHGLIGIQGGIGSGGGSAGVTVVGGRFGLDFTGYLSGTQPTPTITGFTLLHQTEAAIRSSSRQTLVAAGLKVVLGRTAKTAVDCTPSGARPNLGQLSLVDSQLSFARDAVAADRSAIRTASSVYLRNVYVEGATALIASPTGQAVPLGNRSGWSHIGQCAFAGQTTRQKGVEYSYPIYIDGVRREGPLLDVAANESPPPGLQARHLWTRDFPSWESPRAANVKRPPYNAAGDGRADDTAALQRAIDESEIVFLPKGYYRLTDALELKPHTKLIGVGQHLSVLVAVGDGKFSDPARPTPLLRTADDPRATTTVAFCGLFAATDLPGVQALHWRSGGTTIFRAVEICEQPIAGFTPRKRRDAQPRLKQCPLVLITGSGGGRWYNFRDESAYHHGADYRHVLIDGARGPLHFYQCSPQHVVSDCAIEMRRSQYVSFFGFKYEGNAPMLRVIDCDHICSFGHGGNGKPLDGSSLYIVERTPNCLFANLVEGPTAIVAGPHKLGQGDTTDPRNWSMLVERQAQGELAATAPLERPALYRRGAPQLGPTAAR